MPSFLLPGLSTRMKPHPAWPSEGKVRRVQGYSMPGELGQEERRAPSPLRVILLPWDLVLIPDPRMDWQTGLMQQ